MKLKKRAPSRTYSRGGFTFLEVLVSFLIAGIAVGGIIRGYALAAQRAEWSAYSLAAQSMAIKRLEQVVSAPWIPQQNTDQLVTNNFPPKTEYLCLPTQQTNLVNCTNFTTITTFSASPLMKMVRVDCVWTFINDRVFTNTVATIRAPNL
jgi:Tfp pilus assembly protein PilV